jgi:uncharacterized RDD family membrane protein YckC
VNGLAHAAAPPITGPALDNKRVAAAVIDLLVLFFVGFLVVTLAGSFTPGARLLVTGWVLYYYFALELLTGQTAGKKLMGLRVAQADGAPADMRQVAIRTVLRLVDGIGVYLVGLVAMLVTGQRRQRLGDLAAGTIVTAAEEDRRRPEAMEDLAHEGAPVVPLHQPEQAPPPPPPPEPAGPPAAEEPPAFEPYRAPEPPAPAPVTPAPQPVAPAPVAEPVADEPRIELVPDPPVQKPKIEIVSPIDLVMADDEDDQGPQGPPPPQPA